MPNALLTHWDVYVIYLYCVFISVNILTDFLNIYSENLENVSENVDRYNDDCNYSAPLRHSFHSLSLVSLRRIRHTKSHKGRREAEKQKRQVRRKRFLNPPFYFACLYTPSFLLRTCLLLRASAFSASHLPLCDFVCLIRLSDTRLNE
ncbi:MAG: hypothetical protein RL662_2096 [Bacteroidota bacterium]